MSDPGTAPVAAATPVAAVAAAPRRVGILGGTFDPPHVAHLAIAEEAREALCLERVLFVPAGRPWQKSDRAVTAGHVRLAMVEAAIADNPAFAVDRGEIDRPGPTYTADTLAELAAREPAGTELWLILSAEAVRGLPTWHEPARVLALARLCVAPRGPDLDAGAAVAVLRAAFPVPPARIVLLDRPRLEISSTEVRDRVRAGRSIRYLVPDGVAELVTRYALYRPDPAPDPGPVDA